MITPDLPERRDIKSGDVITAHGAAECRWKTLPSIGRADRRVCDHCASTHPADFVNHLYDGARVDWIKWSGNFPAVIYAGSAFFYYRHFTDLELEDADFLSEVIYRASGIGYYIEEDDNGVGAIFPHVNYQP